jgi:hypothetical protein
MFTNSGHPVFGKEIASTGSCIRGAQFAAEIAPGWDVLACVEEERGDDLARLAWITRSNERLATVLRAVSERLQSVRKYLSQADANVTLGMAYYRYWRAKHSGVLALLRANRVEARLRLARIDPTALEHISDPTAMSAEPGDAESIGLRLRLRGPLQQHP